MTNIPEPEYQCFLNAVVGALDLAAAGYAMTGLVSLQLGLSLARAAAADGETWGDELVRSYELAVGRYAVRCVWGSACEQK